MSYRVYAIDILKNFHYDLGMMLNSKVPTKEIVEGMKRKMKDFETTKEKKVMWGYK